MSIIKQILLALILLLVSIVIVLLIPTAAHALPILFDDGGTHNVNYVVSDGIVLSNQSTVNIQTGASISGSVPYTYPSGGFSAAISHGDLPDFSYSNINVQGGQVNGDIGYGNLTMSGGLINGSITNNSSDGGVFDMSGGVITGTANLFEAPIPYLVVLYKAEFLWKQWVLWTSMEAQSLIT